VDEIIEFIKFFFDEDVGGSYLGYAKPLDEVLRKGRQILSRIL